MTIKPVILRILAEQDIERASFHYRSEGGEALALDFIEDAEQAFRRIGRSPAIGSPRYAYELSLEGLRVWPLRRFPYLIFYIEQPNAIDVLRVLHGQRDIPSWMQPSE
ncbi:MAG: type II toxin-antitoxin system RelE/ParE family toxin [Alphaproteobacteria bacterium]